MWEIDRLKPEQVKAATSGRRTMAEPADHSTAEPYPGAVEAVRPLARGRATSSRSAPIAPAEAHGPTRRVAAARIELPYDELYC